MWAMALSTWDAIAHYFLGLPTLGLVLPLTVAATVLAWPGLSRRFLIDRKRQRASVMSSTQ